MNTSRLYVFRFSHFCEKVLWARDHLNVNVETVFLLPGLHTRRVQQLSDQTAVPVLTSSNKAILGSTAILEHWANSADFSRDVPGDAIAWAERADLLGPAIRGALFEHLLTKPAAAARLFTASKGIKGWSYAGFMRLTAPILKRRIQANTDTINSGLAELPMFLQDIAQATENTGYLIGDQFSLADLAVAAMLFPLSFPPESGHTVPVELAQTMDGWIARWSAHPAIAWVNQIYAVHRQPNPGSNNVASRSI